MGKITLGIKTSFNDVDKCRSLLGKSEYGSMVSGIEVQLLDYFGLETIKENIKEKIGGYFPAIHVPFNQKRKVPFGLGFVDIIDDISPVFEIAAETGKKTNVILHIVADKYIDRKADIEKSIILLGDLLDISPKNADIMLENVYPSRCYPTNEILNDRISDFQYIFDNIKNDRLGICLDTSHAGLSGNILRNKHSEAFTVEDFIRELGDKIKHVHLADYKGILDKYEGLPLGSGELNLKSVIDSLKKFSKDFFLVPEIKNDHSDADGHIPYDYTFAAYELLRKLL